jgi:uncharacterized membrane protein
MIIVISVLAVLIAVFFILRSKRKVVTNTALNGGPIFDTIEEGHTVKKVIVLKKDNAIAPKPNKTAAPKKEKVVVAAPVEVKQVSTPKPKTKKAGKPKTEK